MPNTIDDVGKLIYRDDQVEDAGKLLCHGQTGRLLYYWLPPQDVNVWFGYIDCRVDNSYFLAVSAGMPYVGTYVLRANFPPIYMDIRFSVTGGGASGWIWKYPDTMGKHGEIWPGNGANPNPNPHSGYQSYHDLTVNTFLDEYGTLWGIPKGYIIVWDNEAYHELYFTGAKWV